METLKIVLVAIAPLTSFACMALLFRSYLATRSRLLLWSAVCFVGQTISNAALFVDIAVLPETDLLTIRLVTALIGLLFLIYGFISETE